MKSILISLAFLLIVILSYSQDIYPSKLILSGDTVVVITPIQMKKINMTFQKYDLAHLENQRLNSLVSSYRANTSRINTINELLRKKNTQLLVDYSDMIKLNETNNKLAKYYNKEIEVQKRKKVKSFFGGLTIGVAITSTLLFLYK